ncbi:MAG TPA: hypothetical protein VJ895_01845 [Candidatus Nanoarchaeia archaeon]|nr:hypothetical protein [Candidatus Nanoarchaeia archaeon]
MNIKNILLGVTIGVVLLLFLVFGSRLIYEEPIYEDYCNHDRTNFSEIESNNQCYEQYNLANENNTKNLFLISLILGILIILGAMFINLEVISGGLMLGSLMFIIQGTGKYWSYMSDWTRFIILGISLGVLIYASYWLNKKKEKRNDKSSFI